MPSLGFVWAPREIRRPPDMASVDEEELWWTIFSVFRGLLFANHRDVPDVHSAVR